MKEYNDDENEDNWKEWDKISIDEAIYLLNEEEDEEKEAEMFDVLRGSGFGSSDENEEETKLIREAKEEVYAEMRGKKLPEKEEEDYFQIEKNTEKDLVKRIIKHVIKNIKPYIKQLPNKKWVRK